MWEGEAHRAFDSLTVALLHPGEVWLEKGKRELWREWLDGETILYSRLPDRRVVREIRTALLRIYCDFPRRIPERIRKRRKLLEAFRELFRGRKASERTVRLTLVEYKARPHEGWYARPSAGSLSEKRFPGERSEVALIRGLFEELGMRVTPEMATEWILDKSWGHVQSWFFERDSRSYPRLITRNHLELFYWVMPYELADPSGYSEMRDGREVKFVWEPPVKHRPKKSPRRRKPVPVPVPQTIEKHLVESPTAPP